MKNCVTNSAMEYDSYANLNRIIYDNDKTKV